MGGLKKRQLVRLKEDTPKYITSRPSTSQDSSLILASQNDPTEIIDWISSLSSRVKELILQQDDELEQFEMIKLKESKEARSRMTLFDDDFAKLGSLLASRHHLPAYLAQNCVLKEDSQDAFPTSGIFNNTELFPNEKVYHQNKASDSALDDRYQNSDNSDIIVLSSNDEFEVNLVSQMHEQINETGIKQLSDYSNSSGVSESDLFIESNSTGDEEEHDDTAGESELLEEFKNTGVVLALKDINGASSNTESEIYSSLASETVSSDDETGYSDTEGSINSHVEAINYSESKHEQEYSQNLNTNKVWIPCQNNAANLNIDGSYEGNQRSKTEKGSFQDFSLLGLDKIEMTSMSDQAEKDDFHDSRNQFPRDANSRPNQSMSLSLTDVEQVLLPGTQLPGTYPAHHEQGLKVGGSLNITADNFIDPSWKNLAKNTPVTMIAEVSGFTGEEEDKNDLVFSTSQTLLEDDADDCNCSSRSSNANEMLGILTSEMNQLPSDTILVETPLSNRAESCDIDSVTEKSSESKITTQNNSLFDQSPLQSHIGLRPAPVTLFNPPPIFKTITEQSPDQVLAELRQLENRFGVELAVARELERNLGIAPSSAVFVFATEAESGTLASSDDSHHDSSILAKARRVLHSLKNFLAPAQHRESQIEPLDTFPNGFILPILVPVIDEIELSDIAQESQSNLDSDESDCIQTKISSEQVNSGSKSFFSDNANDTNIDIHQPEISVDHSTYANTEKAPFLTLTGGTFANNLSLGREIDGPTVLRYLPLPSDTPNPALVNVEKAGEPKVVQRLLDQDKSRIVESYNAIETSPHCESKGSESDPSETDCKSPNPVEPSIAFADQINEDVATIPTDGQTLSVSTWNCAESLGGEISASEMDLNINQVPEYDSQVGSKPLSTILLNSDAKTLESFTIVEAHLCNPPNQVYSNDVTTEGNLQDSKNACTNVTLQDSTPNEEPLPCIIGDSTTYTVPCVELFGEPKDASLLATEDEQVYSDDLSLNNFDVIVPTSIVEPIVNKTNDFLSIDEHSYLEAVSIEINTPILAVPPFSIEEPISRASSLSVDYKQAKTVDLLDFESYNDADLEDPCTEPMQAGQRNRKRSLLTQDGRCSSTFLKKLKLSLGRIIPKFNGSLDSESKIEKPHLILTESNVFCKDNMDKDCGSIADDTHDDQITAKIEDANPASESLFDNSTNQSSAENEIGSEQVLFEAELKVKIPNVDSENDIVQAGTKNDLNAELEITQIDIDGIETLSQESIRYDMDNAEVESYKNPETDGQDESVFTEMKSLSMEMPMNNENNTLSTTYYETDDSESFGKELGNESITNGKLEDDTVTNGQLSNDINTGDLQESTPSGPTRHVSSYYELATGFNSIRRRWEQKKRDFLHNLQCSPTWMSLMPELYTETNQSSGTERGAEAETLVCRQNIDHTLSELDSDESSRVILDSRRPEFESQAVSSIKIEPGDTEMPDANDLHYELETTSSIAEATKPKPRVKKVLGLEISSEISAAPRALRNGHVFGSLDHHPTDSIKIRKRQDLSHHFSSDQASPLAPLETDYPALRTRSKSPVKRSLRQLSSDFEDELSHLKKRQVSSTVSSLADNESSDARPGTRGTSEATRGRGRHQTN